MEKLDKCIEDIAQLITDTRYEENYDTIRLKLQSIIFYANMGLRIVCNEERRENNEIHKRRH